MTPINLRYVLITAAKNEAQFIELTIKSVLSQSVLPLKWVIVNDGSTDETEQIVKKYTDRYPWIELISLPPSFERHFGRKAIAFNKGYELVKHLDYDLIGNLDADISFDDKNYFSYLLNKFEDISNLGIAGTPFREGEIQYDYRFTSTEHVSGACQLFRKECFEQIGGYKPLRAGGIDLYAVLSARMKGWQTQTFTHKVCYHHRKMGTAKYKGLLRAFRGGYHDYLMGVGPNWQLFRSINKLRNQPIFLYGLFLWIGYTWAMIIRAKRIIPQDMVNFRREEEKRRIREFINKYLFR